MGDTTYGIVKLLVKGVFLVCALLVALFYPGEFTRLSGHQILFVRVYHLVWALTILLLAKRLIPRFNYKISSGKIFERHFALVPGGEDRGRENLRAYLTRINRGAARSAFYWSLVIVGVGLLFFMGIFDATLLFVAAVFFIFMDQFCVTVWCPFKWLIGNKCCNACRINNWGYFMAFSPLIFLPSFWTYSVLALAALVIVQWEYLFFRHPERFFEFSNGNLMCRNCQTRCAKHGRS